MTAEVEEWVMQKMAESHDNQDAAERDERVACAQSKYDEQAGNQFDERDKHANKPERPERQESVGERQKIFSRVLKRSQLKDLHHTGHEKDQAENEAREE
jgi:hypothetical protein